MLGVGKKDDTKKDPDRVTAKVADAPGTQLGDDEQNPSPNKRGREETEEILEDQSKKKSKQEEQSVLVKELDKIAAEHKITYTIKNTPSKISSSAILVSFALDNINFALSIRNKSLYERGLSKGLVSFSTSETPDTLSELVADLCTPTSNARIKDIVSKIVQGINK